MKICAFIGDMYRDFALSIIEHLDNHAREHGHRVDVFGVCSVISDNPLHVNGSKSILALPDVHDYDGVIICYDTLIHENIGKDIVEELLADMEAPPVVSIRASIQGFYNIIPDNTALMYDVAKHVIAKCEKGDIGFVTGMDELEDSYERREGFEQAMEEAGLTISEKKIFHGNYWYTQGPEMADFFIKKDGTLPEAIICSNDYEAIALCNELVQRGYQIPRDCMISGIDNAPEARSHIPSITTIEISNKTFVDTAIKVLEDAIAGNRPDLNIYVPGDLILRESTADIKVERDAYKELCLQNAETSISMDDKREFVIINAMFEGALAKDPATEVALEQMKSVPSIKSCYFVQTDENNRYLVGYFHEKGENHVGDIRIDDNLLLPEGMENDEQGTRIHFGVTYKNEVYGYCVMIVDTQMPEFINFKIEYLLSQIGQTINKLMLYAKLYGIADIMTLYIEDPLTGTLNRRGFEKRISDMFDKEGNMIKPISVVSIDMDELKYINDTFGHDSGDDAIKKLAQCIEEALEGSEFVARMGGDEFEVVLVTNEPGRVGKFKRHVRTNIRAVNDSQEFPFELSASIGAADVDNWQKLTDAMKKADKSMYLEKKAKKKNR